MARTLGDHAAGAIGFLICSPGECNVRSNSLKLAPYIKLVISVTQYGRYYEAISILGLIDPEAPEMIMNSLRSDVGAIR